MDVEEARLEVLKIAAHMDMCGGDANRAVEIANKLWRFVDPNAGSVPEASACAPSQSEGTNNRC